MVCPQLLLNGEQLLRIYSSAGYFTCKISFLFSIENMNGKPHSVQPLSPISLSDISFAVGSWRIYSMI